MDKKLFRSLLALITYTVALILLILRFEDVWRIGGQVLHICKPLLIGFVFAFILHRPCKFYLRHLGRIMPEKRAQPLAVTAAYLTFFAVVAGIVSFIVPQLVASIEMFISNLKVYMSHMQVWINKILQAVDSQLLASLDLSELQDILRKMGTSALNALSNAVPQLFSLTSGLVSLVVTGALSFVFSIYMLSGSDRLLRQVRTLVCTYLPPRIHRPLLDVVHLSADTFTRFVSGQLLEACILGGLCFLGMVLLRFQYAPLISVIIGVSALIPVAGAYLGAILSALLLVMISPLQALGFLVFLVILQQIEGNIIYPRVVGTSLGLPGIWVLTAVTVGGGLMGFAGMLIGVPLVAVIYTLVRSDVRRRAEKAE